jgi:predicted nucleic acid-binding protein
MILLDTNIVFEMMKPMGDGNVRRWMDSYSELDFFIATPVIAELRFGLAAASGAKEGCFDQSLRRDRR